jgi:hypothetical protein
MMGYAPKAHGKQKVPFYYWPFFMDGKILASSLFDSMITWTFDNVNHLSSLKKLVNSDYLKNYKHEIDDEVMESY